MRTLNKNSFRLAALFLVFTASACSKTVVDRDHRPAIGTPTPVDNGGFSFRPASQADLLAAAEMSESIRSRRQELSTRLQTLNAELRANGSNQKRAEVREVSARVFAEVVQPLSAVALNPNYSGDALIARSPEQQLVLRRFNEGLILLLRNDPEFVRERGLLEAYWNMASVNCLGDRTACTAMSSGLLNSAADSAFILEQYAWQIDAEILSLDVNRHAGDIPLDAVRATRTQLVSRKFSVLRMAMATRNYSDDSRDRLAILYLMSNRDFQGLPENMRSEYAEQNRLIAGRITAQLPRRLEDARFREQLAPYIADRQLWTRFTLRDQRDQRDQFGTLQSASALMKASCRFYRGTGDMARAIERSLTESDALGNPGFLKELDGLRASQHGLVLENLKLDYQFQADEQLFLVDQIYRGHWDLDIAQECWNSRRASMSVEEKNQDNERLLAVIQNYIRVELVKRIILTNDFMGRVFVPPPNQPRISSRDVFFRAIDDSKQLKDGWEGMISRILALDHYVKATVGVVRTEDKSPAYRRLEQMVLGLRNNIKLVAVYPNMLVLSYYVAAKEFRIDIDTWYGGRITLDSEDVIKWIFGDTDNQDRMARPLFNFGNDARPIRTFENLYAFFYALKTNSFTNISDADRSRASSTTEKVISDLNFFTEVTRRYINNELLTVNERIRSLEEFFGDRQAYDTAKDICQIEAENQARQVVPNTEIAFGGNYEVKLSPRALMERTFVAYDGRNPGNMIDKIYNDNMGYAQRDVREQLYRKYLFIESMIRIAEDHWRTQLDIAARNPGRSDYRFTVSDFADLENKLKALRDNFALLQDVIRKFDSMFSQKHREAGHCLEVFDNVEIAQQHELFRREAGFLRLVHEALRSFYAEVAAAGSDEAKIRSLEATYTAAVNGVLAPGAPGSENPVLRQVSDAALAFNQQPGDYGNFDDITVRGGYTYSRWNLLLRLGKQLNRINPSMKVDLPQRNMLEQDMLYQESLAPIARASIRFQANQSADEFVRTAFGSLLAKRFLSWFEKRGLEKLVGRISTMTEVYANQQLGIYSLARQDCRTRSSEGSCAPVSSEASPEITSRELIDAAMNLAARVHIQPREEEVLRLTFQRTKYKLDSIRVNFLDSRNEPKSVLEEVYRRLNEKRVMMNQARSAIVTFNAMLSTSRENEQANQDWSSQVSDELIFLPENDSVRRITRALYRPTVLGSLGMVRRFETTAKCLEQSDLGDRRYLYEVDILSSEPRAGKWIETRKNGQNILLEQRLMDDFQNYVRDFNVDTKHVFEARQGDNDFGVEAVAPDCGAVINSR